MPSGSDCVSHVLFEMYCAVMAPQHHKAFTTDELNVCLVSSSQLICNLFGIEVALRNKVNIHILWSVTYMISERGACDDVRKER